VDSRANRVQGGPCAAEAADGEVEKVQLLFGQDHEKRFQKHQSFAQRGIEVEMTGVQRLPGNAAIFRVGQAGLPDRSHEEIAELFHDLLQSGNLLDELRALGKQNVAHQAAEARRTLRPLGAEVPDLERRQVRNNSEVPSLLAHGMQDRAQAQNQAVAEFRSDTGGFLGHGVLTAPPQREGTVVGDAQHQIGVFEFVGVGVEKGRFAFRQERAPVLLNRVILAESGATTHRFSPEVNTIYQNACMRERVCCGCIPWAGILPVYPHGIEALEVQFEPQDQFEQRLKKLEQLRQAGYAAYPHGFRWTATAAELAAKYAAASGAELEATKVEVRVAGRIVSYRLMGKAGFAHLQGGGGRLQIYARKDVLGERGFELFHLLDLGDQIGVSGHLFRTKAGELSIWVEELTLLAKALLPLPEKWHGLTDVESRYRQRYLDLVANDRSRQVFLTRARIVQELRRFFDARGYVEVETPMMQAIAGGAAARPFVTHHNALDIDLYLRIAPELFLKRLVVGGLDRVYEINRNFRNEGISTQHNPEFTMLEFYEAYSDYRDLMTMNEELLAALARNITGSTTVKYGPRQLDFAKVERLSMREAIRKYWPEEAGIAPGEDELARPGGAKAAAERYNAWAQKTGAPYAAAKGAPSDGEWTGLLFETMAEDKLQQPTILYDFPTDISPLSKQKPDDPSLTERFEVYIAGMEIANGFSELNDPAEQERRFLAQIAQGGEEVPKQLDVDYLRALAHGLPPTAGEGIGIDRLTMLLTDSHSIRDVILFPQLRPENARAAGEATAGHGG